MQLQSILLAALTGASAVLAAPSTIDTRAAAADGAVQSMATGQQWTITNMKRTCNAADTSCTWTFGIDASVSYPKIEDRFPIACTHVVKSNPTGKPASESTSVGLTKCGFFSVTSSWSAGAGGANQGFTTLSVFDTPKNLITYPSYLDTLVDGGKVVKPNRSFAVNNIN